MYLNYFYLFFLAGLGRPYRGSRLHHGENYECSLIGQVCPRTIYHTSVTTVSQLWESDKVTREERTENVPLLSGARARGDRDM